MQHDSNRKLKRFYLMNAYWIVVREDMGGEGSTKFLCWWQCMVLCERWKVAHALSRTMIRDGDFHNRYTCTCICRNHMTCKRHCKSYRSANSDYTALQWDRLQGNMHIYGISVDTDPPTIKWDGMWRTEHVESVNQIMTSLIAKRKMVKVMTSSSQYRPG